MCVRSKLVVSSIGAVVIVLVAVAAWPAFRLHGYFYQGRCGCGHDIFVRIQGDGLFRYSPGHGVPEYRAFRLRALSDGWDIMGVPHGGAYWSPSEGQTSVLGHIRFRDGALWESWGSSTNLMRLPRVRNILRVWWPKLLRE